MEPNRRILSKIDKALKIAIEAESKLKKRNSNIIEPLKKTCEIFQEKKELNKIDLKEDKEGICRAALITLFLNGRYTVNKYIRTNYYLTTKNEKCIKEGLKISETINLILKNENIKKIENKQNLSINKFYEKFNEVDTIIYILNKYKKDFNNGLLELKKLKNENILFLYGLLFGFIYDK